MNEIRINGVVRQFTRLAHRDGRDKLFAMGASPRFREAVASKPFPKRQLFPQDVGWYDQGDTPECTAYAWTHYNVQHGLVSGVDVTNAGAIANYAHSFYCDEQTADPWPGDCTTPPHYDGTTARAGADVSKKRTYIVEYRWCQDANTVIQTLAYGIGEIVIGVDWYDEMMNPSSNGIIRPRGSIVGGHCVVLNGFVKAVNGNHWLRGKNSWGRTWGDHGNFWLRKHDLPALLADDGEFCVPILKAA